MQTEAMLLILALGVFIGFSVGRWWAEQQRARSDMRRVWDTRRGYRDS
jgi:hypothetical protein